MWYGSPVSNANAITANTNRIVKVTRILSFFLRTLLAGPFR